MNETAEEFIEKKESKEIGRIIKNKDISREGFHFFKVVGVTYMQESENPEKVFEIMRLEYQKTEGVAGHIVKDSHKEIYRLGYYIVGKIGNKKGRWTWGQFCPIIPIVDLFPLLEKAKEEGTIL